MLSLLRAQVADAVLAHADAAIHADLIRLLARPGYALHEESRCRAGLFALEVYAAVRRRYDRTSLVAAAAVELQMESASLFDDIADRPDRGARAEDLALAIALLTAGTAAAAEATSEADDPPDAMRHFGRATGRACAGQFLDAALGRRGGATLEESLRMTGLKSGSLGTFAAGFAARLAGADAEGTAMFEQFGCNLFTFAQLVDDQRDAFAPGAVSDLALDKATLPVVYHLRCVANRPSEIDSDAYDSSAASAFTAILALTYLGRARSELHLLEQRGYASGVLGRLLASMESDAAETLGAVGGGVVA